MKKKSKIDQFIENYLKENNLEIIDDKILLNTEADEEFLFDDSSSEKLTKSVPIIAKHRILHPYEKAMLTRGAKEYLLELTKTGRVDGLLFELIMNRFHGYDEVTRDDINDVLKEFDVPETLFLN